MNYNTVIMTQPFKRGFVNVLSILILNSLIAFSILLVAVMITVRSTIAPR